MGILYRIGKLCGVNRNAVNILCYHSISDHPDRFAVSLEAFEKEMEKIATYATFVSLDDVVNHFMDGKKITKPSIAITIDDGYRDVMKILPIVKHLNIPVTLFVPSAPEKANPEGIKDDIPLLNWNDIRYLHNEGFTIGCHSATHADFHKVNDRELFEEIVGAKHTIERELGEEIKYFAYPCGRFNDKAIALVRQAGFRAGFSILEGNVDSSSKRFILPRAIIDKTHQLSEFPAVHSSTTFLLRKLTDPFDLWNKLLKYDKDMAQEKKFGKWLVTYKNLPEAEELYDDIFHTKSYYWDGVSARPFILDLGAHIGLAALYFKERYPQATVVSFEANPETFSLLEKNVRQNHLTGVQTVHAAVGKEEGTATFHIDKRGKDAWSWGDSIVINDWNDPKDYEAVTVPAVRLSAYMSQPVDILKIDVEGAETEVLEECADKLSQVKRIVMEFHHSASNPDNDFKKIIRILRSHGFRVRVRLRGVDVPVFSGNWIWRAICWRKLSQFLILARKSQV